MIYYNSGVILENILPQFYLSKIKHQNWKYLTKPQLIEIPSLARSPVAPVRLSLSEPARSTKLNLAVSISYSYLLMLSDEGFSSLSSQIYKEKQQLFLHFYNQRGQHQGKKYSRIRCSVMLQTTILQTKSPSKKSIISDLKWLYNKHFMLWKVKKKTCCALRIVLFDFKPSQE